MSPCACLPGSLTSVSFARGVVMQRCGAHEVQTWLIDGEPTDAAQVLPVLRELFVDERGRRSTASGRPPRTVVLPEPRKQPTAPTQQVAAGLADDPRNDDRLTALLNARGLAGSWSVA